MKPDTKILHGAGGSKDELTGALSMPIYNASTYHQKDVEHRQEYVYTRDGNPTRNTLEKILAGLEDGAGASAFASGVAAIFAALTSVLKAGDHIVATDNIYGGTYRILEDCLARFGVSHTYADTCSVEAVQKAIRPETKVLFLESPSNPLLKIIDFEAMALLAQKNQLITMADNTFLSPYFFQPLRYGIDMSIHSATKFLGGHSDLLAGAVVSRTKELAAKVHSTQHFCGAVLSPENSWLLMRGIKTLGVRMKAQQQSAMVIADWLKKQGWVKEVYYPGLEEHPGHDIIKKQASGFGSVVSFKADDVERVKSLLNSVKIWSVAVSLGGVESILSYPAKMSHAAIPADERAKLGITNEVVRLSVGLEDPEDLIADLDR